MLHRAKLSRKMRFLELFFKTTFNLPDEFDADDIRQIEILFRGITEGEFSISDDGSLTVFNYEPSIEDLQNTSVSQKKEFSFEFTEDLLVLGKYFPTGKMTAKIKKGAFANPNIFKKYEKGEVIPNLRLINFDYQIHHRFEKYSSPERLLKNKQRFEQFRNDLRKEEPDFLVSLLEETLARDITEELAIEIVEGLLQYHDFPDRFSVLKPILENNQWRIPIALTYPKQEPIWLEDAFVDVRTGKVEMKISFDELLKKGRKKSKEAFSVE